MSSVNVYVVDHDGSSRYRLEYPAAALASQGYDVEVHETGIETRDADVLVFNRPTREDQAVCVEQCVELGKRVIVEVDDNYDLIPPEHAAFNASHASSKNIHRACAAASIVTVSTPALLETYGYGHGYVFPNYVHSWSLDVQPGVEHDKPWVMWYGSVSSHPNDIQTTRGQVAKAMKETDAELAYIGPKYQGAYVKKFLSWKGSTRLAGWFDDQKLLMGAIASATVGIVPLANTQFNQCKSYLKGMEFASLGVPFIASATDEYVKLNKLGAGLIAYHDRDWYFHTRNLLQSKDLREEVSGRGKEACSKLTIEEHASDLHAIWTQM